MTSTKLPELDASSLSHVVATLTRPRLSKYLRVTRNNVQQALRLYVLNTKVSAAVMTDLHYIEVALRNKFDRELAAKFGHEWFKDAGFLALVDGRSHAILLKAQKDATKHWPKGKALPSGKASVSVMSASTLEVFCMTATGSGLSCHNASEPSETCSMKSSGLKLTLYVGRYVSCGGASLPHWGKSRSC